ncbi:MAG: PorP/SprF family type IX secretion system membrane protein [Bacteroidota bacterium]
MRLTKTLLFVAVVLAGCVSLQAQDLHNSLFYMNPLHMNPAFSGAFEGTYRIGGLYRDQGRAAIGSAAYSTPTIFADAPILMVGKRSWLGVGVLLFQDQAGDGQLRTTSMQLSGSLHLSLDKKSKNIFSVGVQWGRVGRSIEDLFSLRPGDLISQEFAQTANAMTEDNLLQGGGGPNPGSGNQGPSTDFSDINAGFLFKSKVNKNTDFNIGVAASHITTPGNDYNFGSSNEDLNMRITAHAQLTNKLNDKWSIQPELYFSNISPQNQIQLHGWAGYMLKPEKRIQLNFGLGYRVADSGQFLLGLDYGDIKAALAYDITLSELSDVNSAQGGFEIAVYYIGKIFKKPDVKPAILCPHL